MVREALKTRTCENLGQIPNLRCPPPCGGWELGKNVRNLDPPPFSELGNFGKFFRKIYPLRSSEDDHKTSLNHHQSLSCKILLHYDIINLTLALKLKKLGIGPFHLEL